MLIRCKDITKMCHEEMAYEVKLRYKNGLECDNVESDLAEIGCGDLPWAQRAQNGIHCQALASMSMNFGLPITELVH
jgi:hypothetical protein